MGEHFKRQRTKRFTELAAEKLRQFKQPRLQLQDVWKFRTTYQCRLSGVGRAFISRFSQETSLLLMRQAGASWVVLHGNQEVGQLSEQSAADLSEKEQRHGLPDVLNASFSSVSELSGTFEINCQLPEPESAENPAPQKSDRGRS